MIITISGVSGAGKSSTAIKIAEKLGMKHYSMGDLQRKLAEKHNMSTVEFSKIESKDPKYDKERDELLIQLGKTEDNFVIDTWLGAKFIPDAFNVFLDCNLDIRAQRIFKEVYHGKNIAGIDHKRRSDKKYSSLNETKKELLKKEELNRNRWLKYYDFDYKDKKNYDFVLDTSLLTIKETVNAIIIAIKEL
ncbi:AAA family ATPase [Candidatus Woesearchaeota archaeon]|nr:AAA family ATPase [Candidatus Woesearchaeota archaeon]